MRLKRIRQELENQELPASLRIREEKRRTIYVR